MGKNNPRTKFLSNKKQKARKMGIDVSGIKITNKLSDTELQALDNILNDLIKSVKPNYKPKTNPVNIAPPSVPKPKRPKRSDSATNLIKEYKELVDEYEKSIPKELMQHDAFYNYFMKGQFLVNTWKVYDLQTIGYEVLHFDKVKDFKNYFGTKGQKQVENMLKNEIALIKDNMYNKQVIDRQNMIFEIIDSRDTLYGQQLTDVEKANLRKRMSNMNLIQLIELTNKLENSGNVFDSIYEKEEVLNSETAYENTIDILTRISKERFKPEQYGN